MDGLRVTFVLPFLHPTGGVRLVLDHAAALIRRGHQCTVVYPTWPYRFHHTRRQQLREWRARMMGDDRPWWRADALPIHGVPLIRTAFLPAADAVVATSWPTIEDVARLGPSRGRRFQLLMHDEHGTGPDDAVDWTFRAPLTRVVLCARLRAEFTEGLGVGVAAVVSGGVDHRTFFPEPVAREVRTVLMFYHPDRRKGADVGLEAVARLRDRLTDVRLVLCGSEPPSHLPPGAAFVFRPTDDQLRLLYSRSTVLLYPSRYEGFGLPPLEAMACGCPVVSTNVGAVAEFTRESRAAVVVEPGDIEGLARGLEAVCSDQTLSADLSRAGRQVATAWSVDNAAAQLERVLVEGPPDSRVCAGRPS